MPGWLGNGTITATMTSDQASLMPTSLDALTTLDLTLIAAVAILSLVSGGLAFRLQGDPQTSKTDDKPDLDSRLSELQEQLKAAQEEFQQSQQQLKSAQAETKDAREEAELTLLQLHQVQEELEHYFLDSRSKDELLQQYNQQTNDMKTLISEISRSKA